jgi:hypothetical protein
MSNKEPSPGSPSGSFLAKFLILFYAKRLFFTYNDKYEQIGELKE